MGYFQNNEREWEGEEANHEELMWLFDPLNSHNVDSESSSDQNPDEDDVDSSSDQSRDEGEE